MRVARQGSFGKKEAEHNTVEMAVKAMTVELLTGENFVTWKLQCQCTLMRDGLWELVDGSEVEPDDAEAKRKYRIRKNKALGTIILTISTKLHYLLGTPTEPRVVWTTLENQFQKKTWSNVLQRRKKLHSLKLADGESVQEHLKQLTELMDELAIIDTPVKAEDRVMYLLESLPESMSVLVTALEASEDIPIWAVVVEKLLHEEIKIKARSAVQNPKEEEGALAVRERPKCFQCGKTGHFKANCRERGRKPTNEPRRRYSPQRDSGRRNYSPPREDRRREAYIAERREEEYQEGMGLLVNHALLVKPGDSKDHWIVDSGATTHMSNSRQVFATLQGLTKEICVTLGDGKELRAVGRGTVCLDMTVPAGINQCTLHDVLLVPDLAYNLFSVYKAAEAGNMTEFTRSTCRISYGNKTVAEGVREGGLYFLKHQPKSAQAHVASVHTWHRRFGHLGRQSLLKLQTSDMVEGLDMEQAVKSPNPCEPCLNGRQSKIPFPSDTSRAKGLLDLIHSDVCGKVGSPSLAGAEYFLTFIDSHSHYTWVYILKRKSQVFETFKRWQALVENYTGRRIKTFRTDGGGEFTSTEFSRHLENSGVRHEVTIPRTPEQNGVAERMNRTLMESVRSMLADSGLPKQFWAEALSTATYLRNRSPTTTLPGVTPEEVWSGTKPRVNHLKVFGCQAYAHVPGEERTKLDSKTRTCWMLGYGGTTKGYRLYDQKTKTTFYSRNVRFQEHPTQTKYPALEESGEEDVQDEEEGPPSQRRTGRRRAEPDRLGEWVTMASHHDPLTRGEALSSPRATDWKKAMQCELDSLAENEVWTLADLPKGKKAVGSKWVFKTKTGKDGEVIRYKARLVARGFSQIPGCDYDETFSPVVRGESLRAMFALSAQEDMVIHQMDVETAFLNGNLEEEVYMMQPEGSQQRGREQMVCKLHKSIYGLKQSPRCWNQVLDEHLKDIGFNQLASDPCVYRSARETMLLIAVYVDDLLVAGRNTKQISAAKESLSRRFRMHDLGPLQHFLGILVQQDRSRGQIWIGQPAYITKMLHNFGMEESKPVSTPSDSNSKLTKRTEEEEPAVQAQYQAAVGCLLYLSTKTRPDVAFAVGNVARFCSDPSQTHWSAVKRILRYLQGTIELGILYQQEVQPCIGFSDADWGGSLDDRKSTSGYLFMWNKGAVSWRSQKQKCVALSTAESEYVALASAAQEAIWMAQLIGDMTAEGAREMEILEDNQSAIEMSSNPKYHGRTKHIDIRHHFIRDQVEQGNVRLTYCPTKEMVADLLTKSIPADQFKSLRRRMGVRSWKQDTMTLEKEC